MSLYTLKREDLISYSDYEGLPSKLEIKKLDSEMLECFKENCNGMYKEWHHALKLSGGGTVAVALINEKIVGYGQLKTKGDIDKFYKIGKHTAYLSAFYVASDYRGHCIYPALISRLIEMNPQYDKFLISAYTTNLSSISGLTKVGFVPIKTLSFRRILRVTLNKYHLHSERN